MEKYNQNKTIKNIEKKYMRGFEKETSNQQYKPFFTIYAKQRHILNPFKYIFGEYKFRYFEKNKQPKKYKNAFEMVADSINLDTSHIVFKQSDSRS